MTNLIRLPATTTMTAQQALNSALADTEDDHLTDVLICGYTEGGVLYIRSSRLTCAEALFLANKAALWAQNGGELESQMQGLSNEINDFQNTIERQKREIDALKADNLDLRSDEALNEAEALIRQAGAALLPHKSTVLRWYTPIDAALDAIEEYFK